MANSLRKLVEDAYLKGQTAYTNFRKVPALASVANMWVDLSMSPGNPRPNFYIGAELECTVPTDWYKKGLLTGGNVSPLKKYLHKFNLFCGSAAMSPAPFFLCDYLMYYPLIDMDNTDEQKFINYGPTLTATTDPTVPTLPRYTDGKGVMAFLVATNPYIGGAKFQIKYTNSDGVSDRWSKVMVTNTSTNIGQIVNTTVAATGGQNFLSPFIELQAGDTGIRSVQSIQFLSANGGLACLVLCRPITHLGTRETTAWTEVDFIMDRPSMPRIYDGAFLGLLTLATATVAAVPVIGEMTTIWSD
jgi:hypothetical protein